MSQVDDFSTPDFTFDFDEATAPKDFEPIPRSVQDLVITESEPVVASTGAHMVKVTFQVEGGDYNERLLWENWVMPTKPQESDPEYHKKLKKYKEALGFLQRKLEACVNKPVTGSFKLNPMDLLGCRLKGQLDIEPAGTDKNTGKSYPAKNVIRKYISVSGQTFEHPEQEGQQAQNGGQPAQAQQQQPPQSQEQAGASSFRI